MEFSRFFFSFPFFEGGERYSLEILNFQIKSSQLTSCCYREINAASGVTGGNMRSREFFFPCNCRCVGWIEFYADLWNRSLSFQIYWIRWNHGSQCIEFCTFGGRWLRRHRKYGAMRCCKNTWIEDYNRVDLRRRKSFWTTNSACNQKCKRWSTLII